MLKYLSNSDRFYSAGVTELAYVADSKSAARKGLWVRLPPPAPFSKINRETPAPNLDIRNLAYVIGVALGDGNLSNPNGRAVRLRVSCDLKYPFLIGKIKRSLIQAFPSNKVSIVRKKNQGCLEISCFSNKLEPLCGWEAKGGSKFAQRAKVPDWVFGHKEYLVKCLCGLIETDGCIYSDRGYKMVFFVSIIPELAAQVLAMIRTLGFEPRIYRVVPNTKFNSQPRYNIRLSKNVEEFLKIVQPQKF